MGNRFELEKMTATIIRNWDREEFLDLNKKALELGFGLGNEKKF